MATSRDPPAHLPPRKPRSISAQKIQPRGRSWRPATPPHLPPRRPVSFAKIQDSRQSTSDSPVSDLPALAEIVCQKPDSTSGPREVNHFEDLNPQAMSHERLESTYASPVNQAVIELKERDSSPSPPVQRSHPPRSIHPLKCALQSSATSVKDLQLTNPGQQSSSPSGAEPMGRHGLDSSLAEMASLPAIPLHMQELPCGLLPQKQQQPSVSQRSSLRSELETEPNTEARPGPGSGPRPKPSFSRLSTYDGLRSYKKDVARWNRYSTASLTGHSVVPGSENRALEQTHGPPTASSEPGSGREQKTGDGKSTVSLGWWTPDSSSAPPSVFSASCVDSFDDQQRPRNQFRHFAHEIGFCFTIAMTQFLAEYMISGFAIELPKIIKRQDVWGMGQFWPASLLSLILSGTLLVFARISDMYGGYLPFVSGVVWLGIWSAVAGFAGFGVLLDVARAMQGVAIAAFIPSTFAMIGSIYPEGPRKNVVLGLYSACAPLGFFTGLLIASLLAESASGWYFWIAAALSFITAVTAWLTVPHDRTDRKQLDLKMDWLGAFLITAGLLLVSYALAVQPYADRLDSNRSSWLYPTVLAPLILGVACLLVAFWVEGWYASCPLLPFDFFHKKGIMSFSLACLCFYAAYGVWLYESAQFFQSPTASGTQTGIRGVTLAAWYTPTAVGGLILCVAGGSLLHIVPVMALLLVSGLAWVVAPLLLALCSTPISYWACVMPSMLCATLGIDLTFTVSVVFLSAVQPLRYQGLAGAVSSILVNLGMSFSLSISEIVSETAKASVPLEQQEMFGFQAAFLYATASAGVGLTICILFVRISRSVAQEKSVINRDTPSSSSSKVLALAEV